MHFVQQACLQVRISRLEIESLRRMELSVDTIFLYFLDIIINIYVRKISRYPYNSSFIIPHHSTLIQAILRGGP